VEFSVVILYILRSYVWNTVPMFTTVNMGTVQTFEVYLATCTVLSVNCVKKWTSNCSRLLYLLTYTPQSTDWTIGVLGFDSGGAGGQGIFLFTTASRTALGPTQPPIQWVSGALSLGVKRPGCEADHLHLVPRPKNEVYLHSPIRFHGMVLSLKKAGGQLYLLSLCPAVLTNELKHLKKEAS
jgi:hypothetical protein